VRKAFTELGVQRVFAETMAVNHGSRRVLEKAGLVHVRTFHPDWDEPLDGAEHGEVEYALHRCEWRGPRPGVTVFADDEGVAWAKIPVRVTKIVRREDTG
jgi:hypothetical protein